MVAAFNHGPKLTRRQYERAVVDLYSRLGDTLGTGGDDELRNAELNLRIDYRLGQQFPPDRRQKIWEIQQQIEKKRLRTLARSVLANLFFSVRKARFNSLSQFVYSAYADVLTPAELDAYFSDEP